MPSVARLFEDPWGEFLDPLQRVSHGAGDMYASTSLDDVRRHMSAKYLPHQLRYLGGARGFAFETAWASFSNLSINVTRYAGEVEVATDQPGDFVALQFSLAGACAVGAGRAQYETGPETLWIMDARRPIYQRMAPGYVQLNLRFHLNALRRFLAEEAGESRTPEMRFRDGLIRLDEADGGPARFFSYFCREAAQGGAAFACPLVRRQLERAAMAALLALSPAGGQLDYKSAGVRPHYVRRAENFIRANAAEEITIEDIAGASNISERALYQGFRRYLGVSPMQYLKNYRLELARAALASGADGRSVTDVAMMLGFSHLGKFAGDYKRRFGESPSLTLRNRSN